MRRAWIAVLGIAVLAMPGVALAHGDDGSQSGEKNRSKACKALRAEMGHKAFREAFGSNHSRRNAHGKCVSGKRRAFGQAVKQAVAECKAQFAAAKSLRHGNDTDRERGGKFDDGDNESNGERRAFHQCVKEKLRAAIKAAVDACETERAAGEAAFVEKYGKGEKKKHAFFRCVVQTLRANQAATATS